MRLSKLLAFLILAFSTVIQVRASIPTLSHEGDFEYSVLPKELAYNGKKQLISCEIVENFFVATVLDENLQETHRITIPMEQVSKGYIIDSMDSQGNWNSREELYYSYISPCSAVISDYVSRMQFVTQTFFNDDATYEYIIPEVVNPIWTQQFDSDNNGEIDEIITYHSLICTKFKVVTEMGTVLHELELPENINYWSDEVELLDLGEFKYVVVYASTDNGSEYHSYRLFYRVETGNSKMELVRREESNLKVARGGNDNIVVSFDSEGGYDSISIFDALGREVVRRDIQDNASEASINTNGLSRGTYVVTATSKDGKRESCKITIR